MFSLSLSFLTTHEREGREREKRKEKKRTIKKVGIKTRALMNELTTFVGEMLNC